MTARERWAACGAMVLTGDADGAPLFPATEAAAVVDDALEPFGLDASVLGERAASAGLTRQGATSCGGASRLLRANDGWIALTLSRPEDLEALPAVFESDVRSATDATGPWSAVASLVADRPAAEVVARATLLGVPASVPGEASTCRFTVHGAARVPGGRSAPPPFVVDLAALWAGPFTAACLADAGADVVKVEDVRRPDGGRRGDPAFFDLLNASKRSVGLDFGAEADRARLEALVTRADIVITSARARAIHGLGLDPETFLSGGTDRVWVAVTGHGWASDRVGFGDDAAVAGGLVAWHPDDGAPRFAGDAIADPLCGALAARAALDAWHAGGRWFVDASLAGAAASVAATAPADAAVAVSAPTTGQPGWQLDGVEVALAVPRRPPAGAPVLGADTRSVLAGLAA